MNTLAFKARILLPLAAALMLAAPAARACLPPGAKVSEDSTRGAASAATTGCRTPVAAKAAQRRASPARQVQINPQPLPPKTARTSQ